MLNVRPKSPAVVIAVVALLLTASGDAWAARSGQHTGQSVAKTTGQSVANTTGKRGPRGLQGPKGPRGAQGSHGVQGLQGAQGPIGPSNGYVKSLPPATALAAGVDTTVVQLTLTPGSSYIVIAAAELGNASGATNLVSCTLLENNNPIGGGSAYLPALNVFAQTITLTAATTGGDIKLTCNPAGGGQARHSVIQRSRSGRSTRNRVLAALFGAWGLRLEHKPQAGAPEMPHAL